MQKEMKWWGSPNKLAHHAKSLCPGEMSLSLQCSWMCRIPSPVVSSAPALVCVVRQGQELWFGCSMWGTGNSRCLKSWTPWSRLRWRQRGCVPLCLSANKQFLGHFLKGDLQGQKGISKTCISIHWIFIVNIFWRIDKPVTLGEQENSIKRDVLFYCMCWFFSSFWYLLGGVPRDVQGPSKTCRAKPCCKIPLFWL